MVSLFVTKWTNPIVLGVPAVVTVVYIHPKANESGTTLQVMQNIQSLSPEAPNSIL